ncbi:nuclear transport factor 2 family protein [Streptosporangium nondiastaticum]
MIVRMDHVVARKFVDGWVTAWNAHDLEALLAHFAEDVTFRSPVAAQLLGGDGIIRGKAALRAYWAEGLRRIPGLRFEVIDSYVGVGCLVINYRNQKGGLVNEVLIFDGPLVVEGYGTYPGGDADPAGAAAD